MDEIETDSLNFKGCLLDRFIWKSFKYFKLWRHKPNHIYASTICLVEVVCIVIRRECQGSSANPSTLQMWLQVHYSYHSNPHLIWKMEITIVPYPEVYGTMVKWDIHRTSAQYPVLVSELSVRASIIITTSHTHLFFPNFPAFFISFGVASLCHHKHTTPQPGSYLTLSSPLLTQTCGFCHLNVPQIPSVFSIVTTAALIQALTLSLQSWTPNWELLMSLLFLKHIRVWHPSWVSRNAIQEMSEIEILKFGG